MGMIDVWKKSSVFRQKKIRETRIAGIWVLAGKNPRNCSNNSHGSLAQGQGGGGVLKCTVDHILQEFYTLFLTGFRNYKIASPPLTKMTSKDDSKGLVSLKFLRP